MGRSSGARFVWWGPIHQGAGQSPDQETHLFQRADQFGPWLYKPHHGRSTEKGNKDLKL